MEEIIVYNLGAQRNLSEEGWSQLESEREILRTINIPFVVKQEERSIIDKLERVIEIHPADHTGVMPCIFRYSVNINAIKDGYHIWIGGEVFNSNTLREIADKKYSAIASG